MECERVRKEEGEDVLERNEFEKRKDNKRRKGRHRKASMLRETPKGINKIKKRSEKKRNEKSTKESKR